MNGDGPYVLAVSVAQAQGGAALLRGEAIVGERDFPPGSRGGGELKPAVLALLALVPDGRVDAVATALGPGSFTGARVGLAFAQFFALGREIPLCGVSDLAALALAAAPGELVAPAIVAHDGRWCGALYRGRADAEPEETSPARLATPEAFADEAARAGARLLLAPPLVVRAADVARAAVRRLRVRPAGDEPLGLEPLYLEPAAPERVRP